MHVHPDAEASLHNECQNEFGALLKRRGAGHAKAVGVQSLSSGLPHSAKKWKLTTLLAIHKLLRTILGTIPASSSKLLLLPPDHN